MWCLLHRLGRRRGTEEVDESAMLPLIQVYFCTFTQGEERGALLPSLFTRFISRSRQQARTLPCLSHCFPFLSRKPILSRYFPSVLLYLFCYVPKHRVVSCRQTREGEAFLLLWSTCSCVTSCSCNMMLGADRGREWWASSRTLLDPAHRQGGGNVYRSSVPCIWLVRLLQRMSWKCS